MNWDPNFRIWNNIYDFQHSFLTLIKSHKLNSSIGADDFSPHHLLPKRPFPNLKKRETQNNIFDFVVSVIYRSLLFMVSSIRTHMLIQGRLMNARRPTYKAF